MPRNPIITTLWTAAVDCNVKDTCPGEHRLADRPGIHYVITTEVDDDATVAYLAARGLQLRPGEVLGAVPVEMSPDGYLVSTLVVDRFERALFARMMGPGEQLGTIPACDRALVGYVRALVGVG